MSITLGGRYRLLTMIGGGGMGEVWRAHDDVLDREVAVKVIRPHLADDDTVRARLQVEARLAGSVHHPGIVDVFDYGEDTAAGRPVPFIVMPLVAGEPLSSLLAGGRTLSSGETMALVAEVASALQVAHDAGIVHRDLKPANVMVTPDRRAMLMDFGIAHGAGGEPLTQTGTLLGTADYLSPEQAAGRTVTGAADLYALGVVAHLCLSGAVPFHRDSDIATALAHLQDDPPPLPGSVPPAVRAVVAGLLAKSPQDRPATARDVADSARPLATVLPLPTGSVEPVAPTAIQAASTMRAADDPAGPVDAVPADRSRRPLLAAVLAVAALALVGGWLVWPSSDDDSPAPEPTATPVAVSTVEVPGDLEGLTYAEAKARLTELGLEVTRTDAESDVSAGTVIAVDPTGRIRVGRTVELTVSSGPAAVAPATSAPSKGKAPKSKAPAKSQKGKGKGKGSGKK